MTHFSPTPVPVHSSPMEDAIVAQVEWYMGRLNLQNDEYLKQKMDDDHWVSLDVILAFPKMIRLGVSDKQRVATLLEARSTIVEVDEKTCRIRPAWAHRSTIVIHDLPLHTRPEEIAVLFTPPDRPAASGLLSVHPVEDVYLAVFDSPSGATDALPFLTDKSLHNVKLRVEVHVDSPLRPDFRPQIYPSSRPSNDQYPLSPVMQMGMPVPVLHPPPDLAQYPYAPPGYVPPYGQLPRQFIPPRHITPTPSGYMMAYPQAPPFDQLHLQDPSNEDDDTESQPVPTQPHGPREDPALKGDYSRDHPELPAYRNRPHQPARADRARDGTRTPRTSGTAVDGPGRAPNGNRKSKKGSRANNGRNAHERHPDSRDAKADSSADSAQKDDRKSFREDKKKPEPNLNSMHFPPLPMSNDTSSARTPQPIVTKPPREGKNSPTTAPATSLSSFAPDVSIGEGNHTPEAKKVDVADSASLDTDSSAVTETKESLPEPPRADVSGDAGVVAIDAVRDPVLGMEAVPSEKKAVDIAVASNGSTMSYAAILRSKKPSARAVTSPRVSPDLPVVKVAEPNGDSEGSASGNPPPKDRNGRRRKGNHQKNVPNGEVSKDEATGTGATQEKMRAKGSNGVSAEVKAESVNHDGDGSALKSKANCSTNRAHPVWVNKPKSLFLATSSVPSSRVGGSTGVAVDGRKDSMEEEAGKESESENQGKTIGKVENVSGVTSMSNGDGEVNEISLEKANVSENATGSSKKGKSEQSVNGQGGAKGAWASGGPKAWPKNNDAMLLERSSGISES